MSITAISLTDPASGATVPIKPRDGVEVGVLDIQPAARAVEEDRAGGHGSYDTTAYMGAAAVSLTMTLWDTDDGSQTMAGFMDELTALLRPSLRPALVVTDDAWPAPRQLTVRFDSASKPYNGPPHWQVQLTWKAPAAVWEAVTPSEWFLQASLPSTTGLHVQSSGLHVPVTGLDMPATTQVSGSEITAGGMDCPWQARLYGPCSGPAFVNDTLGQSLIFTSDLTLAAGDYVFLDSQLQTAKQSSTGLDVTKFLNFAASDWWQMPAGTSVIRYAPAAASPGAEADLIFRPSFLA